jgi:class 3 adenylate cyclase
MLLGGLGFSRKQGGSGSMQQRQHTQLTDAAGCVSADCTVLFCDLEGFTSISAEMTPDEVVSGGSAEVPMCISTSVRAALTPAAYLFAAPDA